ncbi:MAG: hypothetical protein RIQ33_2209, partial [Bacteroidota bacterium]
MKKNLLIILVMSLMLFKHDVYSQCSPTSPNQVYNNAFGEPGVTTRFGGYMCATHDTLEATNMGGQNNFSFNDGDGYGIRLLSGSVVVISIMNSTDTISITMNDTSCSGNPILGAYAPPAVNNTLTFTATYSGLFHIVFNKNGFCGNTSFQSIGDVMVVLTNAGSITCPTPPANDNICGATIMTAGFLYTDDNSVANEYDAYDSLEVVDNGYNCSPPNNTLWYSFTPTTTTYYNFTFSSPACGLYGRTGLIMLGGASCSDTVISATCLNSLNNAGSSATSKLLMTAGTTYYFMIDGRANGTGVFNVMIDQAPPPPPNDTICNAVTMTLNTVYNGDNTNAYPVDPTDAAAQGAGYNCSTSISGSLWYKFTPPTNGNYAINTTSPTATGINAMVGVFTANACTGPFNSGYCFSGATSGNNSSYTAYMAAGITYYLMVEPANNGKNAGLFTIQIAQGPASPANDTICGATQLVLNTPVLDDNTTALTIDPMATAIIAGGYTFNSCGTPNNILWYKFTPADTAGYIIETTSPATGGLHAHVGIFAATRCDTNAFAPTIAPLGCYEGCNVGTTADDTVKLNKGTTYYIFVDGYQNAKGQYSIEIKLAPTGIYSIDANNNSIIVSPNPANNFVKVKF